jgi:hypothetical protein
MKHPHDGAAANRAAVGGKQPCQMAAAAAAAAHLLLEDAVGCPRRNQIRLLGRQLGPQQARLGDALGFDNPRLLARVPHLLRQWSSGSSMGRRAMRNECEPGMLLCY